MLDPDAVTQGALKPSLPEVFGSVRVDRTGPGWRQMLAFLGPGFIVSVGYMDPGNWATSIAAGSKYGNELLYVAVASSLMAMVLQALSARLGLAAGLDLAQACRNNVPRWLVIPLWLSTEAAMIATDLAEVIGSAVALKLLFGLPLIIGVALTVLDVLIILALQQFGFRIVESVILALIAVVAVALGLQVAWAAPAWHGVLSGLIPETRVLGDHQRLFIALGILGATVMPHNLYLHSAVVQTRAIGPSREEKRRAIRFATFDSLAALGLAMLINAAILILAAAAFHAHGRTNVTEISDAYQLIAPVLGAGVAPVLFALALLACGFSSAVTGTLAGQVVMEGFLDLKLPAPVRRLLTRSLAIVPAAIVTVAMGEHGAQSLLVLSQVVLSLQLPFAMIPLVWLTANSRVMRGLPAARWLTLAGILVAVVVTALNLLLLVVPDQG